MQDTAVREAGSGAPPRTLLRSWWMLAVLFVLYVLSWLDRNILSMLVGDIKADLGVGDFQIGLVLGPAFALFYAVFGIPLGWAADRYPRRWVIFAGVLLWSLAAMASGLARSFPALFLARMGVGVGEAALSPAAYSLLADGFPRHRLTTATAIYQMGIKVGTAASFTLGAFAIVAAGSLHVVLPGFGELRPWQLVLLITGAPGLILAFLALSFTEPARTGAGDRETGRPARLWPTLVARGPVMFMLLIGFGLVNVCSGAVNTWAPEYISRHFHLKPIVYGPVLSAIQLGAAVSLVLKGAIVDWLYGRGMKDAHLRFYTWLIMATIPISIGGFLVEDVTLFLFALAWIQVVAIPYLIYMAPILQILMPNELRGQTTAVFLFVITMMGSGLAPPLVGGLTEFVFKDPAALGYSMSIVTTTAFVLVLILFRFALKPVRAAMIAAEIRHQA